MPDGTYVLTYRVVSADSHPIAGSLTFSVGEPSDTVLPPSDVGAGTDPSVTVVHGVVQGVTYTALLLAAGLAVFLAALLPGADVPEQLRRRLRLVARVAAVAAVVGAVLLVPVGVLYQQGLGLSGLATGAPWTGWVSADGLLAASVAVGLGTATATLGVGTPTTLRRVVVLAGAGAALAAPALVGHTRSYGPSWLVVASDVVHVLAAATWFGGLVGLAVAVPALAGRERVAAVALARFSTVAGAVLALVAVTGVLLGWRVLGSWASLVTTGYGLVLVAKTTVVAAVAAVAAWNRFHLLPRVSRATGSRDLADAARRLRTTVRAEAGGLVVVLLLTGFLVNQVPREDPDTAATEPSTVTAVADDVRVVAHLEPGRVGPNVLSVQVQDLAGEPLEPYAAPVVSIGSATLDLGSRPVRNVASGTYRGEVVLPSPGTWQVQVSVRTGEFDNPVLTLQTTVGE